MSVKPTHVPLLDKYAYRRYLPSAYDSSMSVYEELVMIREFLNQMITRQNELLDYVDAELQSMQKQIDELIKQVSEFEDHIINVTMPDNIAKILNEWFDNGKLAEIINYQVFDMKADKTYVDEEFRLQSTRTFVGERFPVYISHNGLNFIAPINCLPAYELAGECGYKYVEVDIRTTKDNVWCAFHDDNLEGMTNGTGPFKDKTLAEIRDLLITKFDDVYAETRIPTLEEFLILCKKWAFTPVIEIKVYNDDSSLQNLVDLLVKYGYEKDCIVMAFGTGSLDKVRKIDNTIPLCLLSNEADDSSIQNAKNLRIDYVSINKNNITTSYCDKAHKEGIKVGAWTTDDEDEATKLTTMGVDIITSNSLIKRGVGQYGLC